MEITVSRLMALKKTANEARDKVIQAEATMVEVDNNIASAIEELKGLGIKDYSKASEEIEKLESKQRALYEEAKSKIEKWV